MIDLNELKEKLSLLQYRYNELLQTKENNGKSISELNRAIQENEAQIKHNDSLKNQLITYKNKFNTIDREETNPFEKLQKKQSLPKDPEMVKFLEATYHISCAILDDLLPTIDEAIKDLDDSTNSLRENIRNLTTQIRTTSGDNSKDETSTEIAILTDYINLVDTAVTQLGAYKNSLADSYNKYQTDKAKLDIDEQKLTEFKSNKASDIDTLKQKISNLKKAKQDFLNENYYYQDDTTKAYLDDYDSQIKNAEDELSAFLYKLGIPQIESEIESLKYSLSSVNPDELDSKWKQYHALQQALKKPKKPGNITRKNIKTVMSSFDINETINAILTQINEIEPDIFDKMLQEFQESVEAYEAEEGRKQAEAEAEEKRKQAEEKRKQAEEKRKQAIIDAAILKEEIERATAEAADIEEFYSKYSYLFPEESQSVDVILTPEEEAAARFKAAQESEEMFSPDNYLDKNSPKGSKSENTGDNQQEGPESDNTGDNQQEGPESDNNGDKPPIDLEKIQKKLEEGVNILPQESIDFAELTRALEDAASRFKNEYKAIDIGPKTEPISKFTTPKSEEKSEPTSDFIMPDFLANPIESAKKAVKDPYDSALNNIDSSDTQTLAEIAGRLNDAKSKAKAKPKKEFSPDSKIPTFLAHPITSALEPFLNFMKKSFLSLYNKINEDKAHKPLPSGNPETPHRTADNNFSIEITNGAPDYTQQKQDADLRVDQPKPETGTPDISDIRDSQN